MAKKKARKKRTAKDVKRVLADSPSVGTQNIQLLLQKLTRSLEVGDLTGDDRKQLIELMTRFQDGVTLMRIVRSIGLAQSVNSLRTTMLDIETLVFDRSSLVKLSSDELLRILQYLQKREQADNAEIAETAGMTATSVIQDLAASAAQSLQTSIRDELIEVEGADAVPDNPQSRTAVTVIGDRLKELLSFGKAAEEEKQKGKK